MPRKNDYLSQKMFEQEMFTDRAGRSRRAFKIKEPRFQFNKHVAIAVAVMVVACGVILVLTF